MKQIQRNVRVPLATTESWFFKLAHKPPLWIARYSDCKVEATVLLFQTSIAYKNNGKWKFNAVLTKALFAFPAQTMIQCLFPVHALVAFSQSSAVAWYLTAE